MKFMVGDKVKMIGWRNSVGGKKPLYGEIGVITSRYGCGNLYPYLIDIGGKDSGFCWCDDELEPVTVNQEIVIITDGKTTTAKLLEDNKVTKTAEAKCNPEDTFDFKIGAEIAFNRLVGKLCGEEAPKPKKYPDGKYICVEYKRLERLFTVGKVYELKNGEITSDIGYTYPVNCYETALDFLEKWYTFIPYVED